MRDKDTPVQYLKGVGPKRKKLFSRLGISTVEDLLYYFPKRYEDRSVFTAIADLKLKETQTIKGRIMLANLRKSWRRRLFIFQAVVADKSGKITCLWFNQPYLKDYLKTGEEVILYGAAEERNGFKQMVNPEYEIVEPEKDNLSTGRIVPIYPLTEGFTQRYLRKIIKERLEEYIPRFKDVLPFDIRSKRNLLNLAQSLLNIHFPASSDLQKEAFHRLSFEEFFLFQIPVLMHKLKIKQAKGLSHDVKGEFLEGIIERLPFKLTAAQAQVLEEIKKDMAAEKPMHRLLQGDVGSGKTVVAFLAGLIALKAGSQVAFMVPTEILAQQHYRNFRKLFLQAAGFRIGLLTSGLDKKQKKDIYKKIADGKIDLVIGTHALVQEGLRFKKLGLVVIDEQHKFGVSQRQLLPAKGTYPDLLIMTATPLPRTLSLTIYGDLDVSVINELPQGRLPVETLFFKDHERGKVYSLVRDRVEKGDQAYIIYPIIEESLVLDLRAAQNMYAQLKAGEFKQFKVGLLHGRMKEKEASAVIEEFRKGKIDILVATAILEVGMDVPEANCMVVEHAERFGLSQLHQLRGRIGRGSRKGYCLLVAEPQSAQAVERIKTMVKLRDGFRIAEEDLRIRGPGEFFGKRQHGLSRLRIGNPLTQMHILKDAREEAIRLVNSDSQLALRQNFGIREFVERHYPQHKEVVLGG